MQRISSKKSPIRPIYALAAAVLAAGALSVSAPAFAAPTLATSGGDARAASISDVVLVGGNGKRGQGKGGDRLHQMKKDNDRDDDRWGRDDHRWDRNRHDDRGHVQGRHDRGNHYGWERGNHYGWGKNGRNPGYDGRWSGDRSDWRAERRHSRWTGQHIGRVNSSLMPDYEAYNLPRPGPGQYYARSGNDAYLVTEGTQRILDAFVLRGLVR